MKIILNDHIEQLGERGESVAVKAGYANNYLLPKGLAYPDTPGNRKRFEQEQTKWEEMDLEPLERGPEAGGRARRHQAVLRAPRR